MPLDADMKRVVTEQSLGFVATVCPDGTPNVPPKGTATLIPAGSQLEAILDFYKREPGPARDSVRGAVIMRVDRAAPLISPAYDLGASEEEVAARWREHHLSLG